MDSDWFLNVIEGSSVSTDLGLSFGDAKWDDTLQSPNGPVDKTRPGKTTVDTEETENDAESEKCNDVDAEDSENSEDEETGIESEDEQSDSDCVEAEISEDQSDLGNHGYADGNHGDDSATCSEDEDMSSASATCDVDADISNQCENEENSVASVDTGEQSVDQDEKRSEFDCVFDDSDMDSESDEEDGTLIMLHRGEGCGGDSGSCVSVSPASDKQDAEVVAAARPELDEQEVLDGTNNLSAEYGCDSEEDGANSDADSLNELIHELGDDADSYDDADEDASLMDFAGELGVIGSDSSDSEQESGSEAGSFTSTFLRFPVPASEDGSVEFRGSNDALCSDGPNSAADSDNVQLRRTDSTHSVSSMRSTSSRSSLVRRQRVESTRSARPISIRSNRTSACSSASNRSICSLSSPSKLSRTSLNRIPVSRKASCRSQKSSTTSSSESEISATEPTQHSTPIPEENPAKLGLSEAERSWLPPLAFTDEDLTSKKKPENKAVGVLLKEFVRLRRSVSDEYEIAEKLCLQKKKERLSSELEHLSPQPDADKLEKMASRRAKIISEIMETEKTYQHHLNMIVKQFERPLRRNQIIPDHVVVTIFSNIHQIISINTELWQSLNSMNVGRAFLKMGPFLKLYSTYANNHERALATLMEWDQKSAEFSQFRRDQEDAEDMFGLKLNALLITPVQRVPRYKLLLTDLLENTANDHEDYTAIQEACRQISAVATHINEHIKQQDNFIKMLAIQKSLSGTAAPRLLTPGRMFIKEGSLRKVSKNGTSSRERIFFLFSDILLYAKSKLMESGAHHSYVCCCILPLQHCSVTRVFGHTKEQGALFSISCKQESLLLYSDQKSVDAWMKVLTHTINELMENRQSLRKVSSAKQPLRKAALAKVLKQQKRLDPLRKSQKSIKRQSTRRLQEAIDDQDDIYPSPQLKKSKLGGATDAATPPRSPKLKVSSPLLDCLTPRSRRRKMAKKTPVPQDKGNHGNSHVKGRHLDIQHPMDLNYSEVWKAHNDSCMTGGENSPSRASFHGLNSNTPRQKLAGQLSTGEGVKVKSPRSSRLANFDWDDALQTATQTARLFNNVHPSPAANYNNNGCSVQ